MNIASLIAPADLRDYAKSRGWRLLPDGTKDRLYVLAHPKFARRQLVFPMDASAPDYAEAIERMVEKIAALEDWTPEAAIKSLWEFKEDAISFRVQSPRLDKSSLPLPFAGAMVQSVQQLLLACASSVLVPLKRHPRLNRAEAVQFLETARFGQTQRGSFVLNVSCPVQAIEAQGVLFPDEKDLPFVRRATLCLQRSLSGLVGAIENDTLDRFIEAAKASATPLISANFCEALTQLEDETLKNSVEIGVAWAGSIPRPPELEPQTVVRVQNEYFSRIEEVRRELRSGEQATQDVFIGTVESLNGEMGEDRQRSGEVVLSLLLPEGDRVRARASLNARQYAEADKAHMTEGSYVKVAGTLHPGRQPRQLLELRLFELIQK